MGEETTYYDSELYSKNVTIIFRSLWAIILKHSVNLWGHVVLVSIHKWKSIRMHADKRTKSPHPYSVPAVRSGGVTETKTQLCHFITVHLSFSLTQNLSDSWSLSSHPSSPPILLPHLFSTGVRTIYEANISLFFFSPSQVRPVSAITAHYTH